MRSLNRADFPRGLQTLSRQLGEPAARMVAEHQVEYGSQWTAVPVDRGQIGCASESLRRWALAGGA